MTKKKIVLSRNLRQMLTEQQVIEIYSHKIYLLSQLGSNSKSKIQSIRGKSGPLSRLFGVSSRTIRDIWNRHTWQYATHSLWCEEEMYIKSLTCGVSPLQVRFRLFHDSVKMLISTRCKQGYVSTITEESGRCFNQAINFRKEQYQFAAEVEGKLLSHLDFTARSDCDTPYAHSQSFDEGSHVLLDSKEIMEFPDTDARKIDGRNYRDDRAICDGSCVREKSWLDIGGTSVEADDPFHDDWPHW